MKSINVILGTLVCFALTAVVQIQPAQAGLYVEPYFGFIVSGESKDNTPGGDTEDVTGNAFGGRIGMSYLLVSFGLDYSMGSATVEDSSGGADTDLDTTDLGLFVRVGLPLFHAYAAYMLDTKGETSVSGTDYEYSGKGTKLGVGFTGLPFIAINLEYQMKNYDEISPNIGSVDTDLTAIALGISAPFSF